jgi:hypothetical protein
MMTRIGVFSSPRRGLVPIEQSLARLQGSLPPRYGLPAIKMTRYLLDYFKAIDLLALAALAALACAALFRTGSVWLFIAGILVAIWGTLRVLGWA